VRPALDVAGCVELARLERSGMIESRHLGAAAVVSPSGEVVRSLGDSAALVYPRSSLKPLQAIAVLRAGAPLIGAQVVLASASHAGSPEHIAVVRSILDAAGLGEDALQCPVDWPGGRRYRDELVRQGLGPGRIHMNCSGKHAAFLLACVTNGWSTADYLGPAHPLQVLVRETVEQFTGETVDHSGIDGCGAPVHATSLAGLARAFGRISGAKSGDAARLSAAIFADPWAIDGVRRPNATVIEQLGLVAKLGAEGVLAMGSPSGAGVAVKILDGSARARTLVALELLVDAGEVDRDAVDRVLGELVEPVHGGAQVVGALLRAF
jgi:L-asparaginase II